MTKNDDYPTGSSLDKIEAGAGKEAFGDRLERFEDMLREVVVSIRDLRADYVELKQSHVELKQSHVELKQSNETIGRRMRALEQSQKDTQVSLAKLERDMSRDLEEIRLKGTMPQGGYIGDNGFGKRPPRIADSGTDLSPSNAFPNHAFAGTFRR